MKQNLYSNNTKISQFFILSPRFLSKTEGMKKQHLLVHITSLLLYSQMKAQYVASFNREW